MKNMEKYMDKKGKKPKMSDNEKSAKMNVLEDLRKHAMSMMGDKVKAPKKVVVASDSKEGLEKGLEKAKQFIDADKGEGSLMNDEDSYGETCPHCEGEGCGECEEESPAEKMLENGAEIDSEREEDLDKQIAELMKKKDAIKAKDRY